MFSTLEKRKNNIVRIIDKLGRLSYETILSAKNLQNLACKKLSMGFLHKNAPTAQRCVLPVSFPMDLLKSVQFKKTVGQSSFLSELQYFSLQQQQVPRFWKKWGSRNCLLKMNGLYHVINPPEKTHHCALHIQMPSFKTFVGQNGIANGTEMI